MTVRNENGRHHRLAAVPHRGWFLATSDSMRIRFGLLVLAAAFVASGAALAQSPADTLERLGMLGRWARDCDAAAAGVNQYYYIYERASGGSGAQLRFGSILRVIDNVRRLADNTIGLRLTTLPGAKEYSSSEQVILMDRNRYRTMSSVTHDGKVHIRNGILAADGGTTAWAYRCSP